MDICDVAQEQQEREQAWRDRTKNVHHVAANGYVHDGMSADCNRYPCA